MKRHEAEAIIALVTHTINVNYTGMLYETINETFLTAVVDKPELVTETDGPKLRDNYRWNYRFVPHPEARFAGRHEGRGKYWLYMEGAPNVYLANTNYEGFAQKICDAMNERLNYRRALSQIQRALIGFQIAPAGFAMDIPHMLQLIRRALTDPPPRRP